MHIFNCFFEALREFCKLFKFSGRSFQSLPPLLFKQNTQQFVFITILTKISGISCIIWMHILVICIVPMLPKLSYPCCWNARIIFHFISVEPCKYKLVSMLFHKLPFSKFLVLGVSSVICSSGNLSSTSSEHSC